MFDPQGGGLDHGYRSQHRPTGHDRFVVPRGISRTLRQDATFELMTEVVPRSPDFVFKDGAKVIRLGSKVSHFLVTRVEGDRVRIVHDGREGDARKSDLVPADQAEAYFSDQIKANPQSAFNYLMRGVARAAERRLPERCPLTMTRRFDWIRITVGLMRYGESSRCSGACRMRR